MASLAATYASSMHAQRSPCCQTGYPVMADPLTGRTVCSCQLHTGVPSYLARVPRLPETHFINSDVSQYKMMAADRHTRMYRAPLQGGHIPHPYDAALMTSHPYAAMYPGFDINGIRRKNATRESTSALKAWLFEHRKNPYPTKAEKVMLAIVCQMTLTQVSTWFANARRRLKKERKAGDSDIDLDDIDVDDKKSVADDTYDSDSMTNNTDNSRSLTDASDVSDVEEQTIVLRNPAKKCVQRLFSPDSRNELFLERLSSPADLKNSSTMSSTAVSTLTFAVVSSPLVSSIPSSDSTATISTSAVSPTISSLVGKTVKESGSGSKSKIWSIESIISG